MARLNRHHITYEPEWVVEVQESWHRVISRIQHSHAKPELYRLLINFRHALDHEINRVRQTLDTPGQPDLRVKKP